MCAKLCTQTFRKPAGSRCAWLPGATTPRHSVCTAAILPCSVMPPVHTMPLRLLRGQHLARAADRTCPCDLVWIYGEKQSGVDTQEKKATRHVRVSQAPGGEPCCTVCVTCMAQGTLMDELGHAKAYPANGTPSCTRVACSVATPFAYGTCDMSLTHRCEPSDIPYGRCPDTFEAKRGNNLFCQKHNRPYRQFAGPADRTNRLQHP